MPETLQKLTPNQDLQCYFFEPSAIAALSGTSATGFTVSGTWRQQFDWAVIEWNRDNVFEHPGFRNLPDGDLSGLTISYQETRTNCIAIDSALFPTVAWPSLRVWANDGTGEKVYTAPLLSYASPISGAYVNATVQFTLGGTPTVGETIGVAFLEEHYGYKIAASDTLELAVGQLTSIVNAFSTTMSATSSGAQIQLTYIAMNGIYAAGINGNQIGVYTYTDSLTGAVTWDAPSRMLSGGTSPATWQITLPLASLALTETVSQTAAQNVTTLLQNVRKLRWTYSADLQMGEFSRTEFEVVVSNWAVTGSGREQTVAGTGTVRVEDNATVMEYTGTWSTDTGNYSNGRVHYTSAPGSNVSCTYTNPQAHSLFLGARFVDGGALISVTVDQQSPITLNLDTPAEDVLVRLPLGQFAAGAHTVTASHAGSAGALFYMDFVEAAIPSATLPVFATNGNLALATDWDTEHSLALAPERTAGMIQSLGFIGRVNHYVGALWFYELLIRANTYASATITFTGAPDESATTTLLIGSTSDPGQPSSISHLNLIGETTTTLAIAFELLLSGYTGVRAVASGDTLTIYSRQLGSDGNSTTIAATPTLNVECSSPTLTGGTDGTWITDLGATPRLNRAARDWSLSFYTALHSYGLEVTASFSTELGNGDPSLSAGIAQRYPDQTPVLVSTPALQTNFSPTSLAYWQQVYADMAAIQAAAGLTPYVQFGEVQWWYFPSTTGAQPGMPFYDPYTTSTFLATYGHDLAVITSNTVDPSTVPDESVFLPGLIGAFTAAIMAFVVASLPSCRFEVLYPLDVNDFPLTRVVNFASAEWTPEKLNCLKTESFGFTYERNLDLCRTSIDFPGTVSFPPSKRSHLIGISDPTSPWLREARLAQSSAVESVVLFALDQFCLIGYSVPLSRGLRRSAFFG